LRVERSIVAELVINEEVRRMVARVVDEARWRWRESAFGCEAVRLGSYRCEFCFRRDGEKVYRCLKVSVKGRGKYKYPHPFAVFKIAELFGFSGWDGQGALHKPKDWVVEPPSEGKGAGMVVLQEAWPPGFK
jgi:hypothetical protein